MESLPDPNNIDRSADELAKMLRERPEDVRVEWLSKVVARIPYAGFDLAARVKLSRASARRLVEATVDFSDPSTLQWWLEFYVKVCGLRRGLMMIDQWRLVRPETFKQAGYWAVKLPPVRMPEGLELYKEFRDRWAKPVAERGNPNS